MVLLRGANGTLVHINNSRRCAYGYDQRIEVFGKKGMLQAQNHHPTTVEFWGDGRTHARDPVMHFFVERYRDAYNAEIGYFIECVENGKRPVPAFTDGREALRLADAALESLRAGKAVTL
jgi:myo-inositol 2-dehydrogenase/D-chiro-inositol 1-dehydrogenase